MLGIRLVYMDVIKKVGLQADKENHAIPVPLFILV